VWQGSRCGKGALSGKEGAVMGGGSRCGKGEA
jgi:hypothetical protein